MSTLARSLMSVVLLAAAGALHAEQPFDPAARAKAVAPFIDEQTVAVVHVDLVRTEIDPILNKLIELVPVGRQDVERDRARINRLRDAFLKTGAKEVYVVASLADLPRRPPFGIVPDAGSVDLDALSASLGPPAKGEAVERINGALFVGLREAFERVKTIKPDTRGELARAFEAAGDTATQVLFLPPAYTRRVIRDMMPTLPQEIGGGPSTILTEGLLWTAVGVDVKPEVSLRLVVQSQDKEAAAALRAKWIDVVRFLTAQEAARKAVPDIEKAAASTIPNVEGDRLVLALSESEGGVRALSAVVTPPLDEAWTSARRKVSMSNLKQLVLGMHNYHDVHKSFPAVGSSDASGKMLLSWRVQLLPYVEQQKLYDQFHLDEPWDSEHNRKLIDKMPEVFRCPASRFRQEQGLSTYRVVSGEGTVFPGREGIPFKEIKDGTSNTIMLVEVDDDHAVIWTRPEGLPFDPQNPARGLGGQFEGGFNAAFCDGSVQFLKLPADKENLRRMLLRADGEPVSRP
jgi:prepilin-type processing-associated H-X9-DG protein